MRIKKNDYIQVIAGSETGKRGKVLRVLAQKNKVVVEGLNYVYRHLKKSQQNPQGGRIQVEAPIHISNVMLFCPHAQKPTRVEYKYEETTEQNKKQSAPKEDDISRRLKRKKVRYSKVSKRQI
ncbi:MAG: 50S ribosomal protein L24 [Planctomycetes bacterium]|nr:50S ribosomal protein L24 [Planctomycetota bacterium]HON46022.1 50S ribosomal protein L24 [Planctomycetota bacterium]HRU51591.1 50S ribosomal protein L24 [Planctomycetota bacterium]